MRRALAPQTQFPTSLLETGRPADIEGGRLQRDPGLLRWSARRGSPTLLAHRHRATRSTPRLGMAGYCPLSTGSSAGHRTCCFGAFLAATSDGLERKTFPKKLEAGRFHTAQDTMAKRSRTSALGRSFGSD